MWYTYVIVGIMLIVAGISKAVQDKILYHFYESRFKTMGTFWNPEKSWENKWKDGDPEKGERFPGSSTIFVSLTDAWHLFGMIKNFTLVSAIAVASNNYFFLLGYLVLVGSFHLFFTYIFTKKSI